jgi:hypothetical protein
MKNKAEFIMERRKKIDESLKERHGIVRLLERLKNDDITSGRDRGDRRQA